jgi:peptidyl-prolyl cis-trans isomerase C
MIAVNGIPAADAAEAVRHLLAQRAAELGLCAPAAAGEALDGAIERLLDTEVATPEPTQAECRRHYEAHRADYRSGDLVFARHILFAVTPGAPVEALRRKAEETLHQVLSQPERFAELARERSNCPSGGLGGELGQLQRGESVPEFEREVFGSKHKHVGTLPRLVTTRYGFHVVAIDFRVEGCQLPFEQVRERVAADLIARSAERALRQYVAVLAREAKVEGIDLSAAGSPLVQ